MLFENHDLDDYLLPDDQTIDELDSGDDCDMRYESDPALGMFSDNPEGASAWMERASSRFTRF